MQQQQTISKLCVGSLVAGNNPRTYFDEAEMAELEASIRVSGVIQSLLVRPVENGVYEVVAGERRWRAAKKVFGDDYEVPVLVKEMTAAEAEDLALIENVNRANMSPAEEAKAASKVLGRCEGDRDEAAKRLGWKRATLDKRLALMNCSEGVLKALNERSILLGHAELLAAVPKAKQEQVIPKLLASSTLPTVSQFKAELESIAMSMTSAIFPLDGCTSCHHNSGNQQVMFAEAVSGGHCTNGACFDAKTMDALNVKKQTLEDEYPTVKIVNPGENFTIIKLVAEGATGVGIEQQKACRSCKSFGAAVSNIPGSIGNVYVGQCFDSVCNTKKVANRLQAEKAAVAKSPTSSAKPNASKPASGKDAGKSGETSKPYVVTTVQDTQRVVDYRVAVWRAALKRELNKNQRENLTMLIAIMMSKGGSHVSATKLANAFERLAGTKPAHGEVGQAAKMVSASDDTIRNQMLSGIVITMMENIEPTVLPEILSYLQVELSKHWELNAEFLTLLTKSEIEVIAEEIGLKAALGEKYSKIMSGKKDETIKALLAVDGFDFAGKVPKVLRYVATV